MVLLLSRAHHLQDGYYLQVFGSPYGYLSEGYFKPIITEPILGMQGSKKGYIYGWTNPKPYESRYFLLNTKTSSLSWLTYEELDQRCEELRLEKPDMNKEVNLVELSEKRKQYYQSK